MSPRRATDVLHNLFGRNVRMDLRWGSGDINRIRAFVQELVGLQPDIILTATTAGTIALQRETRTIPIVFASVSDPVETGIVLRLDRPEGNTTGFVNSEASLGGKWLNTGIQDAYNLAWKLALVMRGKAQERLLDSFDAERRPVGAEVVERTRAASMNFGRERATKDSRLGDTQILVNYRGSPLLTGAAEAAEIGLRPGDRAPDVYGLRRERVGFPLRLFDALRGTSHVLLVSFAGDSAGAVARELIELSPRETGEADLLRIVVIASGGAADPDVPGVTVLRDETEAFVAAYGGKPGFVCLVRPDGYIAYLAPQLRARDVATALHRSLGTAGD
jgi:FAD binding domain/ABC transporter substrate binding protein